MRLLVRCRPNVYGSQPGYAYVLGGTPAWSVSGCSILPAIAPNDSLTVRVTPPRAGTFMYHSHFDELGQIGSGLYGSIVVLDKGARYDGATDRVLLISDDGP